jgi:hypothetical protein
MFKKIALIIFSFIILNNYFGQIYMMEHQQPSIIFKPHAILKEIRFTQEHAINGLYLRGSDFTLFQDEGVSYLISSTNETVTIYKITMQGLEYVSGFSCYLYFKEIIPVKDHDNNIYLAITSTNIINYPNKKIFIYSLRDDVLKKIETKNIISFFIVTTDSEKNTLLVSGHCKNVTFWTLDGIQIAEINNPARLSALHACQKADQPPYFLTADNEGNLTIWNDRCEKIKCYQTNIRFSAVHLEYNPDNTYQIIAASKNNFCVLNQTDELFDPEDHLNVITPAWSDVVIRIIPTPETPLVIMYGLLKKTTTHCLALSVHTLDGKPIGMIHSDLALNRREDIIQAFCTPQKLFIASHLNTSVFIQSCPIMSLLDHNQT